MAYCNGRVTSCLDLWGAATITLDDINTDAGIIERVLLAEVMSPAYTYDENKAWIVMRMKMKVITVLLATCFCGIIRVNGQTNASLTWVCDTKYWMPLSGIAPTNFAACFVNDFENEIKEFNKNKTKYKPLIKKRAALYLKQNQIAGPRTIFVGSFTEQSDTVFIYDYEGKSFWFTGLVKSFEDPHAIPPSLVTKIYPFDFLLAGVYGENQKAHQLFLIKWQIANCVMDGMRIDISAKDVANAKIPLPRSDLK